MENYIRKIIIFLIITGFMGGLIFYSFRIYQNNEYKEQLAELSGLSESEVSFLFKHELVNKKEISPDFRFKPSYLIEQSIDFPDEKFEVLATHFELKKESYKIAFKIENRSTEQKEFYLIPVSEKSQTNFRDVEGFFIGEKGELGENKQGCGYDTNKHKQELIPSLAQAYDDIRDNNYQAESIKLTLQPNSKFIGVSDWKVNLDQTDALLKPVYFLVYGSAGGVKEDLNILNIQSYPKEGGKWIVNFTTKGESDLFISPEDKATVKELDFVGIFCGDERRIPRILDNDVIYYPDWECNENAKVVHYVRVAGEHTLKFLFGGVIKYAYNDAAWYDSNWTYRKEITVDNTQMAATFGMFPLYVPIESDSDISGHIQSNGEDIRFTESDGTTLLDYSRAWFGVDAATDTASGGFYVAVDLNLDNDSSSDDTIFVYYGNAGAGDGSDGEASLYDNNLIGLWAIEDGEGNTSTIDSASGNDGTLINMDADSDWILDSDTGSDWWALDFNGTNQYIDVADIGAINDATNFSASMWIKSGNNAVDYVLISKGGWAADSDFMMWRDDVASTSGRLNTISIIVTDDDSSTRLEGDNNTIADTSWHHIAMTFEALGGSGLRLYVDGKLDPYSPAVTAGIDYIDANTVNFRIGQTYPVASGKYANGQYSNVAIWNKTLSAEEIQLLWFNQNESDNELSWGAEETETPPGPMPTTKIKGIFLKLKGKHLRIK